VQPVGVHRQNRLPLRKHEVGGDGVHSIGSPVGTWRDRAGA
jgi:hypothetical protein